MNSLLSLIHFISSLQGVGEKSAERIVLSLILRRDRNKLVDLLNDVYKSVSKCSACGNLDTQNPCSICQDLTRQNSQVCIVADILDLWAIEKADFFKGKYFVLGHKLDSVTRYPS